MMQREDKRWVLAGTVSHGIKCAYPNLPGTVQCFAAVNSINVYVHVFRKKFWETDFDENYRI